MPDPTKKTNPPRPATSSKRRKRVSGEDRRKQIIDTTLTLLADSSASALTTRKIAAAIGLSQPALFRHFENREAILLAAVDHIQLQFQDAAITAFQADLSPLDQLDLFAQNLLNHALERPGLTRLLFDSSAQSDAIRSALRRVVMMQASVVAQLVRKGQDDGLLSPTIDAQAAATLFIGMIQRLLLKWEMRGREGSPLDRYDSIFSLWLQGILPRPTPSEALHPTSTAEPPHPAAQEPTLSPQAHQRFLAVNAGVILAQAVEPLGIITASLNQLSPGSLLLVEAPFLPAPLITLMTRKGHHAQAAQPSPDRWFVEILVGGTPAIADLKNLSESAALEQLQAHASSLPPNGQHWFRLRRLPDLLTRTQRPLDAQIEIYQRSDGLLYLHMSPFS